MVALAASANPVEWQEVKSQYRRIPAFIRRWWLSIPISMTLIVIGIALTLSEVDNPTRDLAIHAIWIFHIITVIRALVAGSTAVSREYAGRTWEPLILTGISVRHILLGKWLGVLHHVAPWMFGLGALRLIMLPVLMLAFVNRYAWWTYYRSGSSSPNTYNYTSYSYNNDISWVASAVLLAVGFTVILTILEVMSSAAIGLAASAVTRRSWLAMIVAFAVRFVPVLLFAAVTRDQVGDGPSWRVLRFTPLALADSGSAALYQLVLPLTRWTVTAHVTALSGVLLAIGLLTALLAVALVVAWFAIRASGALSQQEELATVPVRSPATLRHLPKSGPV
jgi:ABC-type transport system involved in multi-copper enzyme maturation permease subunit